MPPNRVPELQNLLPDLVDEIGEEAAFGIAKAILDHGRFPAWPNPVLHAYLQANRRYGTTQQIFEAAVAQGVYPGARYLASRPPGPPVLVSTLPKSGTLFLGNRLVTMTGFLNLQGGMGRWPSNFVFPAVLQLIAKGGALTIDHIDASPRNLDAIAAAGLRRVLVHLRDPRQATLSWARYIDEGRTSGRHIDRHFNDPPLPDDFGRWPDARRLDWQCETYFPAAIRWIAQWVAVADSDRRFDIAFTEYRQLRDRPAELFDTIDRHFGLGLGLGNREVPPPAGEADNYRAGKADEWRVALPPETVAWMNMMMPPALLERFGWSL